MVQQKQTAGPALRLDREGRQPGTGCGEDVTVCKAAPCQHWKEGRERCCRASTTCGCFGGSFPFYFHWVNAEDDSHRKDGRACGAGAPPL